MVPGPARTFMELAKSELTQYVNVMNGIFVADGVNVGLAVFVSVIVGLRVIVRLAVGLSVAISVAVFVAEGTRVLVEVVEGVAAGGVVGARRNSDSMRSTSAPPTAIG